MKKEEMEKELNKLEEDNIDEDVINKNLDEIVEMISEGKEGTTSYGTKVKIMTEEEMKKESRIDVIMTFLTYFVAIPSIILSMGYLTGYLYFVVDILVILIPIFVMMIVFSAIVNVITTEPWHDVIRTQRYYKGKMWYKWWRWFR